ncbi:hypothetical protein D3C72_1652470 [compost metagenome]
MPGGMGVDRAALPLQQCRVIAEGGDHVADVAKAFALGLAGVEGFQPRQLFAIGLDGVGDASQDGRPLADAQPGPGALVEGPPRRADGRLGIGRAGHRHLRQHLLVGRIDHRPQAGFDRRVPLAVDEELMGRHGASPGFGLKVPPLSASAPPGD